MQAYPDTELLDFATERMQPEHFLAWLRGKPQDMQFGDARDTVEAWCHSLALSSGESADYMDSDETGEWIGWLMETAEGMYPNRVTLKVYEVALALNRSEADRERA